MSGLLLDFEWIDPEGAKGPELRATWGRLAVAVDGQAISFNDHRSRSIRTSVFLPLYPLAEWIATHWWFLFHEIETPGRTALDSYLSRHGLRHGAEGYAVPPLVLQPVGEKVEVQWRPVCLGAQSLEFTASGTRYVSAELLRRQLSDFIFAVLGRLDEQGVKGTFLESEWRAIQAIGPEEAEFCAAAAALGLDPFNLEESQQREILGAGALLPKDVLPDFFSVADSNLLREQARQVRSALDSGRENPGDLRALKDLKSEVAGWPFAQHSPWGQGYRFARDLRQKLHLNGERLKTLPPLAQALGTSPEGLEASFIRMPELPGSLDAAVAINSSQSPGFAFRQRRREEAVRFAFCRALFEYLTIPEGTPLLVTRARSDRQKRNRAFAAEFLAPADLLREILTGQTVGEEELDDLAADFGVSASVIRHQVENHELAAALSD